MNIQYGKFADRKNKKKIEDSNEDLLVCMMQ